MISLTPEQVKEQRFLDNLFSDMEELIPFLEDESITDIAIQDSGEIILSRFGKGRFFSGLYLDEITVKRIILAVSSILGKHFDNPRFPRLEGVLPKYNARVTGILPPATIRPQISIRRPPKNIFTLENYLEENRISQDQYDVIVNFIKNKKNILIGGSTGSGKTTFLNAVLAKMVECTPDENFYIVEDVPEIQCNARMKTPIYVDPKDAAEAVRTAMRWYPDRIIFGELRYGEVVNELLKAWNSGHKGNVTTIHADSCTSMLLKVKSLLREVIQGEIQNLSESIHLCVHIIKGHKGPFINEVLATDSLDTDDFISLLEKNNFS